MKIALFFLLILSGTVAVAQPTLTAANSNPLAGDKFYSYDCDTTGILKGASGPAVTWDFSGLARVDTDSIVYLACTPTPFCDSFPGSELATYEDSEYTYYITDVNKFAFSGIGLSGGNSVYFPGLQDVISYPMAYGTAKADTYYSDQPAYLSFNYGIDSLIGDAYGTLILPSGTYTNVLRMHFIIFNIDSEALFPPAMVDTARNDIYFWYTPGFHNPLLMLYYDTSGNAGVQYLSGVTYYTAPPLSTGIRSFNASGAEVEVYPNPAVEALHVKLNSRANDAASLTMTDMMGRTALESVQENINAGMNDISYNVSSLAAGVYFLRIQTGANIVVKKVEIIR